MKLQAKLVHRDLGWNIKVLSVVSERSRSTFETSGSEQEYIRAIKNLLVELGSKAKLLINPLKSSFAPFNVNNRMLKTIRSSLGWQHKDFPVTHLGLPLFIGNVNESLGSSCVQGDLSTFRLESIFSLPRGALMLIEACHYAYHKAFLILVGVVKKLNRVMAGFLWELVDSLKKLHLISWRNLCRPQLEGGVGLRNLVDYSRAYLIERAFRVKLDNGLWASTVRIVFGHAPSSPRILGFGSLFYGVGRKYAIK